eukprot:1649271-Prymnesium_polylepis.2
MRFSRRSTALPFSASASTLAPSSSIPLLIRLSVVRALWFELSTWASALVPSRPSALCPRSSEVSAVGLVSAWASERTPSGPSPLNARFSVVSELVDPSASASAFAPASPT